MRIHIKYKNVNPSKRVQKYAQERLSKAAKYMIKRGRAELFLTKEGHLYHVEICFYNGLKPIHSKGSNENLFAAIDTAAEKVHRQGLKIKQRVQQHKNFEKSREGRMQRLNERLEPDYIDYGGFEEAYEDAA